jgi:2-iminobutanoate/2-iminopropanoate deaminase
MPKEVISTSDAPQNPAYSQAVKAGDTVYVAGTIGVDAATGEFAGTTIQEQTRQALLNRQAILRAAGAELSDAVMVHTLLTRPEDAPGSPRCSRSSGPRCGLHGASPRSASTGRSSWSPSR